MFSLLTRYRPSPAALSLTGYVALSLSHTRQSLPQIRTYRSHTRPRKLPILLMRILRRGAARALTAQRAMALICCRRVFSAACLALRVLYAGS